MSETGTPWRANHSCFPRKFSALLRLLLPRKRNGRYPWDCPTYKKTMSIIPVGFTYATYGALTITAVTIFGIFKYDQSPNLYGTVGLILIISGVIILNIFGKVK